MSEDLYWELYHLKGKVEHLEKVIEEMQESIYFLTQRINILEHINEKS